MVKSLMNMLQTFHFACVDLTGGPRLPLTDRQRHQKGSLGFSYPQHGECL